MRQNGTWLHLFALRHALLPSVDELSGEQVLVSCLYLGVYSKVRLCAEYQSIQYLSDDALFTLCFLLHSTVCLAGQGRLQLTERLGQVLALREELAPFCYVRLQ